MQPRGLSVLMQCTTITSKEETACRQQPGLRCGCRVHAASSADVEAVVGGGKWSGSIRCGRLQALDPGLALRTHNADQY